MDQQTREFSISVMNEIKAAAEALGFSCESLDIDETHGVPTVVIGYYKNYRGGQWAVNCNVIPTAVNDRTELFTQLHLCISEEVGADKLPVLNEFVKRCNERFMLGSLLIFKNQVYQRYTQVWEPGLALDDIIFQRGLAAFLRQGDAYAKLADSLIDGSAQLEAVVPQLAVD